MSNHPTYINKDIDLCYSPDDEGWYLQRFPDHKTSQIFQTAGDARAALAAINGPTPPLQPLIEWS